MLYSCHTLYDLQAMAIQDRVQVEHLPLHQPVGDLLQMTNADFLPNADDNYTLRLDFIQVQPK